MENQNVPIRNAAGLIVGYLVRVNRIKWQLCDAEMKPYSPSMANAIMQNRANFQLI